MAMTAGAADKVKATAERTARRALPDDTTLLLLLLSLLFATTTMTTYLLSSSPSSSFSKSSRDDDVVAAQQRRRRQRRTLQEQQDSVVLFSGCDVDVYYNVASTSSASGDNGGTSTTTVRQRIDSATVGNEGSTEDRTAPFLLLSDLHGLLKQTHRQVLPYTDSDAEDDDVWKALRDLDAGGGDGTDNTDETTTNTTTTVRLVYRQVDVDASLQGAAASQGGWTREHLWPQSRGAYEKTPVHTDVHHVRPSDWNVNAARGNKPFGSCDFAEKALEASDNATTDSTDSEYACRVPAHVEIASSNDTASGTDNFLPPREARGEIARALLYVHVRYFGRLKLTDCLSDLEKINIDPDYDDSDESPSSPISVIGYMGYLSELLKWHGEYPVTQRERTRNDRTCRRWQGNRNPFVDFPQLVDRLFVGDNEPKCDAVDEDNIDDVAGVDDEDEDNKDNNNGTTVVNNDNDNNGTCAQLEPGSILFVGINSDDPDAVGLVSLRRVPSGNVALLLTDNAFDSSTSHWTTNEGTLLWRVPNEGLQAGRVFGYGGASQWESVAGRFALAASAGDTVTLLCRDLSTSDDSGQEGGGVTNNDRPISAISWTGKDWKYADGDTSNTDLPPALLLLDTEATPSTTIRLPKHFDNAWYVGPRTGTSRFLQRQIVDPNNWQASDTERYSEQRVPFELLEEDTTTGADGDETASDGSDSRRVVAFGTALTLCTMIAVSFAFG